jgi:hypothetical protein
MPETSGCHALLLAIEYLSHEFSSVSTGAPLPAFLRGGCLCQASSALLLVAAPFVLPYRKRAQGFSDHLQMVESNLFSVMPTKVATCSVIISDTHLPISSFHG